MSDKSVASGDSKPLTVQVKGQVVKLSWQEKGKKSLDATAAELVGNTAAGTGSLKRVNARLYSNGKLSATIVAPLIQFDEKTKVITASGGVTLTSSDPASSIHTVQAQWIKWFSRENKIIGNGNVKARGKVASIDAAAFTADTQLHTIRVLANPADARAVIGKR